MNDLAPSATNNNRADLAALCAQASTLIGEQRYREAAAALDQARQQAPNHAGIWNALGLCARELGHFRTALAVSRRAVDLDPRAAGGWSNLGLLYRDLEMPALASACLERAASLEPAPGNDHNLGVAYAAAGRHDAAIAAFTRALGADPKRAASVYARALCHLTRGDFGAGWPDYQARFAAGIVPQRPLPGRLWTLRPYPGQRLLVAFEQGMGDGIWAAGMLPAVKALGGELILECPQPLRRLFASMNVVDRFVPYGEKLPDADWHAHLCSLPGLFAPSLKEISSTPYLAADPAQRDRFALLRRLPRDVVKVGIIWSGNPRFRRNRHRATSLNRFVAAFTLPRVVLFSLQKGEPAAELKAHPGIADLGPLLNDFADTAAAIDALDLIIMTDSATAHLAGAMGKPVWVLLGYDPAWFWLTERSDSPWYSSVRLFRQQGAGNWNNVFDDAAAALLRRTRADHN
jgi:tetratricopeptide (TPR) repeat protein